MRVVIACRAGWNCISGRLLLRVQARGAVYPLRIDPFVQPGEKLTGGSEEIGDRTVRL